MPKRLTTTAVIVRNKEGKYLGVSRRDNYELWGFAGGKCEKNEHPLACAIRELEEETGLVATKLKLVDVRDYLNQTIRPNTLDTVYCFEVEEYTGTLHYEEHLKEKGEGMLKWIGEAELIAGAFGNYNYEILKDYYGLKVVWLVEQHADYEGSELLGAFSTEEKALAYAQAYVDLANARDRERGYKNSFTGGDGRWSTSGGSLTVDEFPLDVDFYSR